MEISVAKHLIKETGSRNICDSRNIMARCFQRNPVIDFNAVNPFHHQHISCRMLDMYMRYSYAVIASHIFSEPASCRCFHTQVELNLREGGKLFHCRNKLKPLEAGRNSFNQNSQGPKKPDISLHTLGNMRSEQFYSNGLAIMQDSFVNLRY